jgi:hypothetical protein
MLTSSRYLPNIQFDHINQVLDYIYKTKQITQHIYTLLFSDNNNKYKKYVVIKLKTE